MFSYASDTGRGKGESKRKFFLIYPNHPEMSNLKKKNFEKGSEVFTYWKSEQVQVNW